MSWGQIRFELMRFAPGADIDLMNSWINASYIEILTAREWKGLEKTAVLQTTAVYEVGTVALTLGSNAVTGTGTTFTAAMTGRRFRRASDKEWYTFTRTADTTGTLDRNYEGATGSGLSYKIFKSVYALASDAEYVKEMREHSTPTPLTRMTMEELNAFAAERVSHAAPTKYVVVEDDSSATPLHQVELYPNPEAAVGLPYTYIKQITKFDGTTTTGSPLPWVQDETILAGARMRILRHLKSDNAADREEATFNRLLQRMSDMEDRRSGPNRIDVARQVAPNKFEAARQ